jgi:hypothetical protein
MKPAWLLLIFGIVCLVISFGIALVSLLVPIVNAPHADFEEAVPFLIGGGCCCSASLLLVLGGALMLLLGRRQG